MRAGKLYLVMLLTTVACFGDDTELPQATLTLEPPLPEIFTGEAVTLRCGVQGGSAGWKYLWFKDSEDTPVLQTAGCSITDHSYTITAAAVSDQGQYWCRGHRADEPLSSQLSDKVILNITERPQAVLTQEPAWTQLYESESVTLRCQVPGHYSGWTFTWYKDGINQDSYNRIDGDRYTISSITQYHSGKYTCKGERRDNISYSKTSDALTLTVSADKPKSALTREPAREIFEGDTVTLSCRVEGGSDGWRYLWYKDSQSSTPVYQTDSSSGTGAGYTISAAAVSHSGEYWCRAERGSKPFYSQYSNAVRIQVSQLFSTPTLTVKPGASVWEGEDVSLQCGAQIYKQGTQLQYRYSKDNEDLRGAGSQYSIPAAGLRDTGRYQCEVEAAGTGVKKRSDSVALTVKERPQAVLTQEPAWTQLYESESVTLRCQVQGHYTDWRITWYKDGRKVPVYEDYYRRIDGDRYTISYVTRYHSGKYTCKGEKRDNISYSKTSDALTLTVSADKPKPALTREPAGEIFEGDTVTLSCRVLGGSDGWRYLWYKDSQYSTPVYQTDSSSGTGAGYTISAAAVSHSGEYWCRAKRGSKPFYSQYSNAVRIQVSQLFSRVTLSASPRATVKEGEALNLTCEATMNKPPRTQIHYTILRDGEPVINSTGPALYSIASTEMSHAGSYTCAVESQGVRKSSQELHIEVQKSWSWITVPLSVSLASIIFILVTILLCYQYKTKGFLFTAAKLRRPADQTPAQPLRGMELSRLGQQPGNCTTSKTETVYAEVMPCQQNQAVHVTDTPSASNGDEILYSTIDLKNTKPAKPRSKRDCDALYSAVLVKKREDNPSAADNSDTLYSELDMKNVKKKGKPAAGNAESCMPQSSQRRKRNKGRGSPGMRASLNPETLRRSACQRSQSLLKLETGIQACS
ncbi:Fc receptor-like protein 5 isoform X2 [Polyodon spathula]|uniref:Fc receptor-like protein 5 isoform X2 n=1 Tax=Polyodon spathula TaxID=7913 RepID=UPI001B7EAE34|nr:Fc receptor-like protein 5 isoform X2 [Polyodon spathula]